VKESIILKLFKDKKIVGSARAYEKEGTYFIGRVIVYLDYQNRGIGKKLMEGIEKCFNSVRYELFTGHLAKTMDWIKNLL